jgi:hypothetical protein
MYLLPHSSPDRGLPKLICRHTGTDRLRIILIHELAVLRRAIFLITWGVVDLRVQVNPYQPLGLGSPDVN